MPGHRVEANSSVYEDIDAGESFPRLHGWQIWSPEGEDHGPCQEAMRWRDGK